MPLPPPEGPRRVGAESLALDVARMISLAFFISARERELSFQSCTGKWSEAAREGEGRTCKLHDKYIWLSTHPRHKEQTQTSAIEGRQARQ